MSWSFDIKNAADKDAAKEQVQERFDASHGHFPDNVKALVDGLIDALPDCENSLINVKSYGHFTTGEYRGASNVLVEVNNTFAENVKPVEQAA